MSDELRLTLRLSPDLAARLATMAEANALTVEAMAHQLFSNALRAEKCPEKKSSRTDDQLLAPLRALIVEDFAQARDWDDLQSTLARHGYTLRERGGGLALYALNNAARICKASDLGYSYSDLMRRFGRPFPGHAHAWLADRVLGPGMPGPFPRRPPRSEGGDDIVLIEPW